MYYMCVFNVIRLSEILSVYLVSLNNDNVVEKRADWLKKFSANIFSDRLHFASSSSTSPHRLPASKLFSQTEPKSPLLLVLPRHSCPQRSTRKLCRQRILQYFHETDFSKVSFWQTFLPVVNVKTIWLFLFERLEQLHQKVGRKTQHQSD